MDKLPKDGGLGLRSWLQGQSRQWELEHDERE